MLKPSHCLVSPAITANFSEEMATMLPALSVSSTKYLSMMLPRGNEGPPTCVRAEATLLHTKRRWCVIVHWQRRHARMHKCSGHDVVVRALAEGGQLGLSQALQLARWRSSSQSRICMHTFWGEVETMYKSLLSLLWLQLLSLQANTKWY